VDRRTALRGPAAFLSQAFRALTESRA